ncbi:MAG TPA: hypothetical protein V6D00_06650 [Pantanalinema sp.]
MRFQHLSFCVALASIPLVLASCADATFVVEDLGNNSNIIQDRLPGTTFKGGSGTSDSGSGDGTGGDGAATPDPSTNPTSITLSDNAGVYPLYPDKGSFRVSLGGARLGIAALSSVRSNSILLPLQVGWSGGGASYGTQAAGAPAAASPPSSFEARMVERVSKMDLSAPIPRYRIQAGTVEVGQIRRFAVPDSDRENTYSSVDAKAVYVDNRAGAGRFVIWVDPRDEVIFSSQAKLTALADVISSRIYPKDTALFGADPTLDDNAKAGDGRRIAMDDDYIHFLFSRQVDNGTATEMGNGILGFFWWPDLTNTSKSNRSKLLYIASSLMSRSESDVYGTIAHELQHLLFSCHRVKQVGLLAHQGEFGPLIWLNEGLSMLAMFENGYGPEGSNPSPSMFLQIRRFLSAPWTYSLTDFLNQGPAGDDSAYGMAALYLQYVRNRLGDGAIRSFHTLDNGGRADEVDLADRVMRTKGSTMAGLFADFGAAVALDGSPVFDLLPASQRTRYGIDGVTLQRKTYDIPGVKLTERTLNGPSVSSGSNLSLKPYSLSFLQRMSPTGLDVSGVSGTGYGTRLILQK